MSNTAESLFAWRNHLEQVTKRREAVSKQNTVLTIEKPERSMAEQLGYANHLISLSRSIIEAKETVASLERKLATEAPRQIEAPLCNTCFTVHNGECY